MNNYIINFKDETKRPLSVSADGFDPPEFEWGPVLFYTGTEKDPTVVHAVHFESVLSIILQP